jgi:hypothetical protein
MPSIRGPLLPIIKRGGAGGAGDQHGVLGLNVAARERDSLTRQQPPNDRKGLLEARHPVAVGEAERAELLLVPARAQAEHEAAAAHLGERGRHPRDQAGRMERRAGHQRAELHALGAGRERAEQCPGVPRPALDPVTVAVEQVVADPDGVEADLLRGLRHRQVLGPADLTLGLRELDPDAHRRHSGPGRQAGAARRVRRAGE